MIYFEVWVSDENSQISDQQDKSNIEIKTYKMFLLFRDCHLSAYAKNTLRNKDIEKRLIFYEMYSEKNPYKGD